MKRPAVVVHWEDCSTHNEGWRESDMVKQWADQYEGSMMISVGILIAKTKRYLLITPLYNPVDDWAGLVVKIPAGCVKKITRIKY